MEDSSKDGVTGRWTEEEHGIFLHFLQTQGRNWKQLAQLLPSRTVVQIRTHAQKFFQKLEKQPVVEPWLQAFVEPKQQYGIALHRGGDLPPRRALRTPNRGGSFSMDGPPSPVSSSDDVNKQTLVDNKGKQGKKGVSAGGTTENGRRASVTNATVGFAGHVQSMRPPAASIRRGSDASELQLEPAGASYGHHMEALRPAVPPSLLITPAASPHDHDSHELAWDDWLQLEDAIIPPANAWAHQSMYSIDTCGKIGMFHPLLPSPMTPVKTPKRDTDRVTSDCSNQSKKARSALDIQIPGTPGTLLAGAVSQLHVRSPVSHVARSSQGSPAAHDQDIYMLHPLGGSNGSITLLPTPVPTSSVAMNATGTAFSFDCEDLLPWGMDGVFSDIVGCSGVIDPLPADPEFGTLFDGLFQ